MKALRAQGISRDDLPFKAPFQPFGSWFALISTGIITIFKGFDTFIPFTKDTFITSYIGLPVFILFWATYKIRYKTKLIPSDRVDLVTGRKKIEEEDEYYRKMEDAKRSQDRTRWRKIWEAL